MTDDTEDEYGTDDAVNGPRTGDREDGEEREDASHEYTWRCTGCKAQYDERPERCDRCGATEFVQFRDL